MLLGDFVRSEKHSESILPSYMHYRSPGPGAHMTGVIVALALHSLPDRSAHWVATDALRELTSARVQARLRRWADRP